MSGMGGLALRCGVPPWMQEVAAGDGSHPGAEGYAELARLVQAWNA